jgi:hypothetical protein
VNLGRRSAAAASGKGALDCAAGAELPCARALFGALASAAQLRMQIVANRVIAILDFDFNREARRKARRIG